MNAANLHVLSNVADDPQALLEPVSQVTEDPLVHHMVYSASRCVNVDTFIIWSIHTFIKKTQKKTRVGREGQGACQGIDILTTMKLYYEKLKKIKIRDFNSSRQAHIAWASSWIQHFFSFLLINLQKKGQIQM